MRSRKKVAVVGAGPTGSFLAIGLARRGHQVVVVDRAGPPGQDGSWPDRGVMQFHQPHGFRPQVADAYSAEMPDVLKALVAAGAETKSGRYTMTGLPNQILRLRRSGLDPVLWAALAAEPNVTMARTWAHDIVRMPDARLEVRTADGAVDADLVLNATGRTRGFCDGLRAPGEEVDGGIAYISRQYRILPGSAGHLPSNLSGSWLFEGYAGIVFEHEADVMSVLIERLADDLSLRGIREEAVFEAAVAAIEPLAVRTDSRYVRPISQVYPGGRLGSRYRGQLTNTGNVSLPGLVHVGDAVCSPSPSLGRGTTTSLMQAVKLLALLDEDLWIEETTRAFDDWCRERVRPWYVDQGQDDLVKLQIWRDGDVDLRLTPASTLIVEANQEDAQLEPLLRGYGEMELLPSALEPLIPRTRNELARGWRPEMTPGLDAAALARLIKSVSTPS